MNSTFRNITLHVLFYHWWIYSPTPFLISPTSLHVSSFPLFSPPLLLSLALSLLSPGLPIHCPSSHNRRTNRTKTKQYTSTFRNFVPNLPVSAILVLPVFSRIFQYLQYWYNQYFLESSSICNTGITSIFQNLPVSAILIFWQWLVSSSIADTGKFWEILGY